MRELVDAGAATPGEIVLLFAAGTDAEWYEEELRALGLPTYRATGRRYFGQQQVVDLLMYLRLLRNRYDDEALVTVLASPFVGVSNDALVLIRRHAGRRPLFTGIERSLPEALDAADERLIRAFKQRYERLVAALGARVARAAVRAVVSEHDYDLAVLARWDGQRRYANLRKLMRLARSYEELRGRDIEGFVRFIRDQEALGGGAARGRLRGGGRRRRRGCSRSTRRRASSSRSWSSPTRAATRAGRGDEILALSDGRFGFAFIRRPEATRSSATRTSRSRPRRRGAAAPLLRRDDARDRPADRVGRGRASGAETPIRWISNT